MRVDNKVEQHLEFALNVKQYVNFMNKVEHLCSVIHQQQANVNFALNVIWQNVVQFFNTK